MIACYTGYYAALPSTTAAQAAAASFVGGFAAGAIQSGNLRGAVVGGISSLAFYGVGQKFSVKGMSITTSEGMAAYAKLALVSGVTGGVMAELQGGRFGNGFVTAGASAVLAPIPEAAAEGAVGQTVIAAVIGGTISEMSGGKFANGAVTAAFQFAVGRGLAAASVDAHSSNPLGWASNPGWRGAPHKFALSDPNDYRGDSANSLLSGAVTIREDGADIYIGIELGVRGVAGMDSSSYISEARNLLSNDYIFDNKTYHVSANLYSGKYGNYVNLIPARSEGFAGWYRPGSRNEFVDPGAGRSRNGTFTHELLHAFGLTHRPNFTGGIMSYAPYRAVTGGEIYALYNLYK